MDTCAAQPDAAYVAAALEAVRQWTFFAAAICEFPAGLAKTGDCSGEGVVVRAVPIRLMYAFAFERSGGKARVRARRAGGLVRAQSAGTVRSTAQARRACTCSRISTDSGRVWRSSASSRSSSTTRPSA